MLHHIPDVCHFSPETRFLAKFVSTQKCTNSDKTASIVITQILQQNSIKCKNNLTETKSRGKLLTNTMWHTFASSNKQNLCYEVLNVKVPSNRGMWWTCLAFPLFTLSILLLVVSCCPTSVKLYKNALLHSNFEFTHLPYNVCRLNRCEGGGAPCYEWWSLIHCTFIVHITTCKQTDRQVQTYSQSHNMSQEATYTKKAQ